jgi:nucleotide-binding universal stress UspA family protein
LLQRDTVERESLNIRRGNVLVPVRDYNTLTHLRWALEKFDIRDQDVVVMSARVSRFGSAAYDLVPDQIFSDYEQTLFTRAVAVAESFGKKVSLLVVPAGDVWTAIVQTANNLDSSAVVIGVSSKMAPDEQAFALGRAWESLPEPKKQFVLQVVHPDGHLDTFRIGPHTPTMKDEDVLLLHRLWLNITREPGLENVHHHEILTEALTRFARDYSARERADILKELRRTESKEAARVSSQDPDSPPVPVVRRESDDAPPGRNS